MNSIQHVAIIMDGNGRWAEQRGLPRWKGHEMGAHSVRRVLEEACRQEVPFLTLFAFSSENWKRPSREVQILFRLFLRYLVSERNSLLQNGIRLEALGRRDRLPMPVREALSAVEKATRNCKRLHLRLALDYGSRHEIVDAIRWLACQVQKKRLKPEEITEEQFSGVLGKSSVPDPDLIIRTAGEQRLSNFLLWQAAYSEFYFCPKLWPDFMENDFADALADYRSRTRKYGALACATGTGG
jgi:undecaprenyl diphosphate synthase